MDHGITLYILRYLSVLYRYQCSICKHIPMQLWSHTYNRQHSLALTSFYNNKSNYKYYGVPCRFQAENYIVLHSFYTDSVTRPSILAIIRGLGRSSTVLVPTENFPGRARTISHVTLFFARLFWPYFFAIFPVDPSRCWRCGSSVVGRPVSFERDARNMSPLKADWP